MPKEQETLAKESGAFSESHLKTTAANYRNKNSVDNLAKAMDQRAVGDTKKRQAEVVAISPLRQSTEQDSNYTNTHVDGAFNPSHGGSFAESDEKAHKSVVDPLAKSSQTHRIDVYMTKKTEAAGAANDQVAVAHSADQQPETETNGADLRNFDAELRARLNASSQCDADAQARVNDAFSELFGALRTNVLGEFDRLRVRHTNETAAIVRRERDAHDRELCTLRTENERLRERVDSLERTASEKQTLVDSMQRAISELDARVVRERHLSEWRSVFLERRCEQRMLILAQRCYETALRRRAFRAWFAQTAAYNWRVRVERACVARAKEVCVETAANYEKRIREMLEQLQNAHETTTAVCAERDKFEAALKQTFIRGIRSLNLDAIINAASTKTQQQQQQQQKAAVSVEAAADGLQRLRLLAGSNPQDYLFEPVPRPSGNANNPEHDVDENAPKASASRAEYEPRSVPIPTPHPARSAIAPSNSSSSRQRGATERGRPRSAERGVLRAMQRNAALVERHDRAGVADNLSVSSARVSIGSGNIVPHRAANSARVNQSVL